MRLILKPGREKSLKRHHPWVFSGAVARLQGEPQAGETVEIFSSDGAFLAQAAYSPESQIVARVWNFDQRQAIDAAFLEARIRASVQRRSALLESGETNAARLVHGESDGLPGLLADRYGDIIVMQILSTGAERWRAALVSGLVKATGCSTLYERSDLDVRALEGLSPRSGPLLGTAPAGTVEILEHGLRYKVNVITGQKTGFYLDQRDNRQRVMQFAAGRKVLNAFSYSGAFTLAALRGGAISVLSIDSSAEALALARENMALNGMPMEAATWVDGDVFYVLRELRDRNQHFDLIILDPPKFAPTPGSVERAARAYKDINLLALKLLTPGGLLATFSCSGGVNADLFQKIVAGAAADAALDVQIIQRLGAASDHAVSIHFPEGEYLKGLVLQRTA
jgi:23S rRNA (cytosine1962-C5)-methyltransferase